MGGKLWLYVPVFPMFFPMENFKFSRLPGLFSYVQVNKLFFFCIVSSEKIYLEIFSSLSFKDLW